MSTVSPGWYKDPADPTTQRYWDGEGWLGDPLPADATPPDGPPKAPPPPPAPVPGPVPGTPGPLHTPHPSAGAPQPGAPYPGGPQPGPYPGGPSAPPYGGTPYAGPPYAGAPYAGAPYPGAPYPGAPYPGAPYPGAPYPGSAGPVPPGWPAGLPFPLPYPPVPIRPHGFALASAGQRLGARILDIGTVFILAVVANAWFMIEFWHSFGPFLTAAMRASQAGTIGTAPQAPANFWPLIFAMVAVTAAVWFAYEVPALANSGQTLGKRVIGIRVVRLDSLEPLGLGRAARRWSRLGTPTLLWPCCGAGLVLQAIDCAFVVLDRPLHQALHDKQAATVVVRTPRHHKS